MPDVRDRAWEDQEDGCMDEEKAEALAKLLGGDTWQSGGGIWLVIIHRPDGTVVAISDEVICEYDNEDAFDGGKPCNQILF